MNETLALLDVSVELCTRVAHWRAEGRLDGNAGGVLLALSVRIDAVVADLERRASAGLKPAQRDHLDSILLRARTMAARLRNTLAAVDEQVAQNPAAQLLEIARERLVGKDGIYVTPDIPDGKRHGAQKKYLRDLAPDEQLIALFDLTVFGRATDGLAVLDRRFIHRFLGEPRSMSYSEVRGIFCDRRFVTVGDQHFDLLTSQMAEAFADFLRGALQAGIGR